MDRDLSAARRTVGDATSLDAVTLSVLKGRLEQIANEMDATLYRSAFNPIIAEARDACHGLYDATTGATLVQGTTGLPIFVGAMAFAVKAVIDKVASDAANGSATLTPHDTFIFNDPYDGGTHLNDFRLVRPVFRGDTLFCWIASVGHWLDIGGNVPGGFNARAVECHQEGVRFPPVKLIAAGRFNADLLAILSANSRTPQSNYGDLNGQLNALDLGETRLNALLDDYGETTVHAAFAALTDRSETIMRASIAALPDGTVSFEDYLDNDGITDAPLRIALDLTISGSAMTLDFSRSAPPCAGPLNIAYSTAVACCYVALKHVFVDVPANAGCLKPITFVIPETTLLAVRAPRPVGGYTETILRVIGTVFGALATIWPERATAAPFGTIRRARGAADAARPSAGDSQAPCMVRPQALPVGAAAGRLVAARSAGAHPGASRHNGQQLYRDAFDHAGPRLPSQHRCDRRDGRRRGSRPGPAAGGVAAGVAEADPAVGRVLEQESLADAGRRTDDLVPRGGRRRIAQELRLKPFPAEATRDQPGVAPERLITSAQRGISWPSEPPARPANRPRASRPISASSGLRVGRVDALGDLGAQPIDDGPGRALRREHGMPCLDLEAGQAGSAIVGTLGSCGMRLADVLRPAP